VVAVTGLLAAGLLAASRFTARLPPLASALSALSTFGSVASALSALDPAHLVGLGGAAGAVARHELARRVEATGVSAGTVVVNVLGTFVLGLVTFLGAEAPVVALVGTGACGAFTTFSSFSVEVVRRWERGDRGRALAEAAGTLLGAGLALALARGVAALV
jgi:CrcB protein